jgi:hypothetical protein
MDFSTYHPAHGALAGLAVYAVTGKPLPALVVGGSLYAYMQRFGHSLPGGGSTPASPPAREAPRMPADYTYRPSHDSMSVALGYTS